VFITGGNRGIGKAIAMAFARAGASFIGLGANDGFGNVKEELEAAAKTAGRRSTPMVLLLDLDVTNSGATSRAADEVRQKFGRLDILCNNSGFMTPALPVIESDQDLWWKTFEVNLKGVYLMARAFIPLLTETTDGLKTVVNTNSVASHNLRVNASAYGTSKWAVLTLTEFLLVELAGEGIVAYSLHPGGIMTRLAEAMPQETHAALTDTPQLAGDTIAFLTQTRREWLSGRYLSCTWDMEELLSREHEIADTDMLRVRLVL
jgi:NAD(P)-dependent dehydrogenase (short-subunit alcohol dehydrogenase family)